MEGQHKRTRSPLPRPRAVREKENESNKVVQELLGWERHSPADLSSALGPNHWQPPSGGRCYITDEEKLGTVTLLSVEDKLL
ncbi:hypothetical protein MUK42_10872 [Musa troglodytarum]|uniref:Uncharacterized protein n=1 Tax=Musa troglodytarum TaxID=320322 RepID=A0A9E7EXY8_9LILI|nr:hypothetical protein MUK42_10872 [Musa troglodytarum]